MDNWGRKQQPGFGNYPSRVSPTPTSPTNTRPNLVKYEPVPSWEKDFCESIGLIPWEKILEAKKFMHYYENIVSWNDTAGEEAFNNAKSLFWAEINDIPCYIELPDPDLYLDKVDSDDKIDPNHLSELESAKSTTVIPDKPPSVGGAESGRRDLWQDGRNRRESNEWNANSYGVQGEWNRNHGWGRDRAADTNRWDRDHYSIQRNITVGGRGRPPVPWNGNLARKEGRDSHVRESGNDYKTIKMNPDGYWWDRGCKNGRGRKGQEFSYGQPHWVRKPS